MQLLCIFDGRRLSAVSAGPFARIGNGVQFATDLVISHKTVMMTVDCLDYRAGTNAAPVNGLQITRAAHGVVDPWPGTVEHLLKRLRVLSEIMCLSRQLRGSLQSYGGSKPLGKLRNCL